MLMFDCLVGGKERKKGKDFIDMSGLDATEQECAGFNAFKMSDFEDSTIDYIFPH